MPVDRFELSGKATLDLYNHRAGGEATLRRDEWPALAEGVRPAGRPDRCFYCGAARIAREMPADHWTLIEAATEEYARVAMLSRPRERIVPMPEMRLRRLIEILTALEAARGDVPVMTGGFDESPELEPVSTVALVLYDRGAGPEPCLLVDFRGPDGLEVLAGETVSLDPMGRLG